ncbi:hypothetical protein [Chitinophaga sp. MM2321]|uniref:hypothetical protein n=1 Tax=Chitinophaga sp. MM2321 TaxID=3137178 RepID=UPI0032D58202
MNDTIRHKKIKLGLLMLCVLASVSITAQTKKQETQRTHGESANLNVTAFGTVKTWGTSADLLEGPLGKAISYSEFNGHAGADSSNIGVFWWNAQDIQRVEVVFNGKIDESAARLATLQYWHHTWPETPPVMPVKEDDDDDPWQGTWLTAAVNVSVKGNVAIYTFKPMYVKENEYAARLPEAVTYRRALKVRLLFSQKPQQIQAVNVFSMAKEKRDSIRIQFLAGENDQQKFKGSVEIFNGRLENISGWNWGSGDKKTGKDAWEINLNKKEKGIILYAYSTEETLPGSNEETVVTLKSSRGTFSFSPNDLKKGPIYVPAFNTYITKSSDRVSFAARTPVEGKTIRERIAAEPEQTYDRARKEIPHLDPVKDQYGGRIYLPLAADASWQKFAVQWGGNIFMHKGVTKLKGKELLRCNWNGDGLYWAFGTGKNPVYDRTQENCQMSVLNDYLPVVNARWRQDGLVYEQETFTTLLRGPLSPTDPTRDEQTPAILMLKLTISNPSLQAEKADIRLSGNDALNKLTANNNLVFDQVGDKAFIRCYIKPGSKDDRIEIQQDSKGAYRTINQQIQIAANSSKTIYVYFPFVGDLTAATGPEIAALSYEKERERIVAYWRDLVAQQVVFNVPERKFNEMAKAVIPHIRISATKDPKVGLYMVPAAAMSYGVYANETVFQTVLLDRLGDFTTAADYLNTFLELQGSRKLPGTFSGDQKEVFYGVKIDSLYDLTFNGYNMHHGTTLWGLAHHYLYSKDREWLLKAAPHMVKAANWIIEQRNHTKKISPNGDTVLHYGLLPAGLLEDPWDWRFWYATDAYAYLGMQTMARAFKEAGLPQADYYQQEAVAYQKDIRNSIEKASALSPVVRLRNNTYVPYVPIRPHQRFRYFGSKKSAYYDRYNKGIYPNLRLSATREALYGPIVLIKTGLVDPKEQMADWILNDWEDNLTLSTSLNLNTHGWVDDEYWFSRGGMAFQANLQNPVSVYLDRQESKPAIRNLYNSFVSCLYPDVNMQSEEYRMWGHGSGPFYKIPDEARVISQICDLLVMDKDGELWLGNGIPERWLEAGQRVELFNANTEFGKVSYSLHAGKVPGTMEADIELPEKKSSKVLLFVRAPFDKPMKSVKINGSDWKEWDAEKATILIPQQSKKVHVTVTY